MYHSAAAIQGWYDFASFAPVLPTIMAVKDWDEQESFNFFLLGFCDEKTL